MSCHVPVLFHAGTSRRLAPPILVELPAGLSQHVVAKVLVDADARVPVPSVSVCKGRPPHPLPGTASPGSMVAHGAWDWWRAAAMASGTASPNSSCAASGKEGTPFLYSCRPPSEPLAWTRFMAGRSGHAAGVAAMRCCWNGEAWPRGRERTQATCFSRASLTSRRPNSWKDRPLAMSVLQTPRKIKTRLLQRLLVQSRTSCRHSVF